MSKYQFVDPAEVTYRVTEDHCYSDDAPLGKPEKLPCWKITRWAGNNGHTFAAFAVKTEAEAVCAVLNAFRRGEIR
jgi:hypothetical protein